MIGSIRFWGYVVYALVIGVAQALVYYRAEEQSELKTARPLAKGELVAARDVTSARLRQVVGHDAVRDFKAGESIGVGDVIAHKPIPSEAIVSLALIADWGTAEKPVQVGDPIKVCLDKEKIVEAKASASTCDDKGCLVTVPIFPVPTSLTNADAIKRLHAEKGDGKDCAGKIGGHADQPKD